MASVVEVPREPDLPLQMYTLRQFRAEYNVIAGSGRENAGLYAARFAVCGIHPEGHAVGMNTHAYALEPNTPLPSIRRDYDSLLGFMDHIPMREEIFVYPIGPPYESLLKALPGIEATFSINGQVSRTEPLHPPLVANVGFVLKPVFSQPLLA